MCTPACFACSRRKSVSGPGTVTDTSATSRMLPDVENASGRQIRSAPCATASWM